jgi:hypothetical protein
VRKGKTARGEPLLYQNPDKWGVVNLWLKQWSWNMMEQQMMTNTGLVVVDEIKWNNRTSEIGLTCGSEPDGTFHGEWGLSCVEHPRKGVTCA